MAALGQPLPNIPNDAFDAADFDRGG